MAYGVVRIQKIKMSNGGGLRKRLEHSTREHIADNIDKSRIALDEKHGPTTYASAISCIRQKWSECQGKRSDSVGVLEVVVTRTGDMKRGTDDEFLARSVKQLQNTFGEGLVSYYIHKDEKEPHLHAFVVPIEETFKIKKHLSKDDLKHLEETIPQEERDYFYARNLPPRPAKTASDEEKKRFRELKKTHDSAQKYLLPYFIKAGLATKEKTLSCQKWCGGADRLRGIQEAFYQNVFKGFGLERRQEGSERSNAMSRSSTSLKKWAKEIDQREQNLSPERLETSYRTYLKQLQTHTEEPMKLEPPLETETAAEYRLRNEPKVEALYDYLTQRNGKVWKLEKAGKELYDNYNKLVQMYNDLLQENNELIQKYEKLRQQRGYDSPSHGYGRGR